MRGKVGWVRSFFAIVPTIFFCAMSRSSCASEYPVIRRRYVRTGPLSFLVRLRYWSLSSVCPIHLYASAAFVLLNVAPFGNIANSLICAILVIWSSCMVIVITCHDTTIRREGANLGSFYVGIVTSFTLILYWTRLPVDIPGRKM